MRFALALVVLAGAGCGKQLNEDFCAAHPADERCTTNDAGRDAAPSDGAISCPSDYTVTLAGMSSRYRLVDDEATWLDAQTDCGNDGATTHLMVLNSDAERQAFAPHTLAFARHVGHSDEVTEGAWLAVTDDPVVYAALVALTEPPWNAGEPDEGTNGNCVTIGTDLDLRDRNCDDTPAAYVCECDGFAPNPANF